MQISSGHLDGVCFICACQHRPQPGIAFHMQAMKNHKWFVFVSRCDSL